MLSSIGKAFDAQRENTMSMRMDERRRSFGMFVVAGALALTAMVSEASACGNRRGGVYHYNGAQGYYAPSYAYGTGYYAQQARGYANGQAGAPVYAQQPMNMAPIANVPAYVAPVAPTVYNSAYTAPAAPTQEPFSAPPAPPVPQPAPR
jgi:hypothetical protein